MLAMHNYQSVHGQFPGAATLDVDGRPKHSWRVRILPFLDEEALHDKYDYALPWDSPQNLKLLDQIPPIYKCPCMEDGTQTRYKLVVGPGSLFDDGKPATFSRIVDGASNTIGLVEDPINPVEWTKPEDVTIEEAISVLRPIDHRGLPHVAETRFEKRYFAGSFAGFDGSLNYGDVGELELGELRKMFGIDDGIAEEIYDSTYSLPTKTVFKFTPWFGLAFFIVLMAIPYVWLTRSDELDDRNSKTTP